MLEALEVFEKFFIKPICLIIFLILPVCLMMLDVFFTTLFFLILSSCFFTLLDLLYIKPHCLPLTKPCFAAWSSLYHVRLPDLVFMMLGCLVFSMLCYAAGPSHLMSGCLMSPKSCYAFYFCFTLHAAALFDLILLMLRCFTTRPTFLPWRCYTARP